MALMNKILVYIDDSDASIAAIQYAILLAKKMDAELFGLYVIDTSALKDLLKAHIFIESEKAEYEDELKADADRYLRLTQKLATSKNCDISLSKIEGSPSSVMRKYVEETKIDILVLGFDEDDRRLKSFREEIASDKDLAMRRVPCNLILVKDIDGVERLFEKSE